MILSGQRNSMRRWIIFFFIALVAAVLAAAQLLISSAEGFNNGPVNRQAGVNESQSERSAVYWQERLHNNPGDAQAYAQLGMAYLQQVRESGDVALYGMAEQAFDKGLALAGPQDSAISLDALIGHGVLALARHEFEEALLWGERAREVNPYRAQALGILVDANVELGRYDEAVAMAQAMVDLRPDLASYSRVSYIRELHGDSAGAIEAMKTAVSSGVPGSEETAWTQVQLGNLYLGQGKLRQAEAIFEEALHERPDYAYALAGIGRVQALRGEFLAAIQTLEPVVERLPLPEFAILLGEVQEAAGQPQAAAQQYDLVSAIQSLNAGAGMRVDMEMALFEADHDDPALALDMARAAYERRPNIHAADTLAWALYRSGRYDEAWKFSQEALRLGTKDARLHAHAAAIADALGDEAAAAAQRSAAQAINPLIGLPGSGISGWR